jgi:hypothetical protein
VTDLSFAIFDKLTAAERLEKLSFEEVIRYRKRSERAREAFLEYLVVLQAKQGEVGIDGDYAGGIKKLVMTEIMPAAQKFKIDLDTVGKEMFGKLATGVVVGLAGSVPSVLRLLGDLSLEKILALAAATAGYIAKVGIEGIVADRKARRECSISYILSLDE